MYDMRAAGGLVGRVVAGLAAFNQRHPWSHNAHFHGWILRHLPERRRVALDAGCGRGELVAALAGRFEQVDGVDLDDEMVAAALARFQGESRVTIRQASFDRLAGEYDVITMVAVLHHLELETALRHAKELLADGGHLLVVGLAQTASTRDWIWDIASAVANPVMGMVKHPRRATGQTLPTVPVADPTVTFDETRATAAEILPGARLRHRLFFRYTLEWTKPH
jgi:2-polyprenyl-3-methyl-5-hydroxy-6-metoxy-1,4-benzoquinol methylase